ncbi:MAG: heavy metal sensor histidine kinase [Saezia sp.]
MKIKLQYSLTLRLTLLFALAAVIILSIWGVIVSSMVNDHFIEQDKRDLSNQITHAQQLLSQAHNQEEFEKVIAQLRNELTMTHGLVAIISDANAQILFTNIPNQTTHIEFAFKPEVKINDIFTWETAESSYRGVKGILEVPHMQWSGKYIVIGMDIAHHEIFLSSFRRSMWVSTAIAAFLMGWLGWLAAMRGLAPLRQLISSASEVTANKLDNRLPVESVPLELRGLAETLNQMLERLEGSFKRLANFSSDIAHELRTPISSIKTQTQVTLSRARSIDEYREALYSNAEELNHLSSIVSNMLFLAQADNGLVIPTQASFNLEEEVNNLFDFYEAFAEERHIKLHTTGQAITIGDRLMIRRALSNLLVNAIKNSYSDSTIDVEITTINTEQVQLSIKNSGDTIPSEHLPKLFDRFYRVDSSRQQEISNKNHTAGVGLGLAITSSIIQAHKGSISAQSENNITSFIVTLPLDKNA